MPDTALIDLLDSQCRLYKKPTKTNLLSCLRKSDFNGLFSRVCEQAETGSEEHIGFIRILIQHKSLLNIDLSHSPPGRLSPIEYAYQNKNLSLVLLLKSSGLPDSSLKDLKAQPIGLEFAEEIGLKKLTLANIYKPDYWENGLEVAFSALPLRVLGHDDETAMFDLARLQWIIDALDFLLRFQPVTARFKEGVVCHFDHCYEEHIKTDYETIARGLLANIATTVQNLSYGLRQAHSKFNPAGFSWFSFEHLGAIMREPSSSSWVGVYFQMDGLRDVATLQSKAFAVSCFMLEFSHRQLIINEAMDSVVADLGPMKLFFQSLVQYVQQPTQTSVEPYRFGDSLRLLTRYIQDRDILIKLLRATCQKVHVRVPASTFLFRPIQDLTDEAMEFPIVERKQDFSTDIDFYAGLQSLKRLGEYLTAKNTSDALRELAPFIDWGAFVAIRDCIAHPEMQDNLAKLDRCTSDRWQFQRDYSDGMNEFFSILSELIYLRGEKMGTYACSPAGFWQNIRNRQVVAAPASPGDLQTHSPQQKGVDRRISEAEEEEYIQQLCKTMKTGGAEDATIEALVNTFRAFCKGEISLEAKKDQGAFLKPIPKGTLRTNILSLLRPDGQTLEQRQLTREAISAEKLQRDSEKSKRFKGLDFFRRLARELSNTPNRAHFLSRTQSVNIVMTSIEKMKHYLEFEGYLKGDMPDRTLAEWDAFHEAQGRDGLAARLVANRNLSEAIQYLAGTLLQHMDAIRSYPEAANLPYLRDNYEALRIGRNYLEHGDPTIDAITQDNPIDLCWSEKKPQKIAAIVMEVINELEPNVKVIQSRMSPPKRSRAFHLNALFTDVADLPSLDAAAAASAFSLP